MINLTRDKISFPIGESKALVAELSNDKEIEAIAQFLARDERITAQEFSELSTSESLRAKTRLPWEGVVFSENHASQIINRVAEIRAKPATRFSNGWAPVSQRTNRADTTHALRVISCRAYSDV